MKIPQELFQFKNSTHWLIVSGKQEAVIYKAGDGELEQIDRLEVEKPAADDKPGTVKMRGHGRDIHSGIALEETQQKLDQKAVKRFLDRFAKTVKQDLTPKNDDLLKGQGLVCIFCPGYIKNDLLEILPTAIKQQVLEVFEGNFVNEHPLELVRMVSELKDKNIVRPTSPEVLKILRVGQIEE